MRKCLAIPMHIHTVSYHNNIHECAAITKQFDLEREWKVAVVRYELSES